MAILSRDMDLWGLIIPKENAPEGAVVGRVKVYGIESLPDVLDFLTAGGLVQ